MIRGTKVLFKDTVRQFRQVTETIRGVVEAHGYEEVIPSSLCDAEVFIEKAGAGILNQMYSFRDKGGRDICLIPEVTAVVRRLYLEHWEKALPKPVRVYYLSRCYRYERPQEGRYREFWQFGVECLGGQTDAEAMIDLLQESLQACGVKYAISRQVKRGLDYYVEDGFEAECEGLGAQKQVAGGGRYDCGIGWAIGVERVMLAQLKQKGE